MKETKYECKFYTIWVLTVHASTSEIYYATPLTVLKNNKIGFIYFPASL